MESWKAEHSRRVSRWSAQKRSQVSRKKMHWREMCCVFPMILVSAILVSSAGLWPAGFPFPAFLPMQVLHRCGYEPTWHSCASFSDAPLRRASVADPRPLRSLCPRQTKHKSLHWATNGLLQTLGRLAIPRPCWSDTQPCSFFASPCPPTVSPLGNGQMRDLVYIGPEYYIFSFAYGCKGELTR